MSTSCVPASEPGTLVKIGRAEHIEQMCKKGVLYLNTLRYFWKIEDGGIRGDVNDGVDAIHRGAKAKICTPDGSEIPANITSWVFREHIGADRTNILCMYSLRESTTPIDDRALEFGDTAMLFTQPQAFFDRLAAAIEGHHLDLDAKGDLVEYVPDGHTGSVGHFCKEARFAWQAEWRLVVRNGLGGPLTLNVGPLNDIAKILPTIDLIEVTKRRT